MRTVALLIGCLVLAIGLGAAAQAQQGPNIIIKVKGQGTIQNNKESGGCDTSTCKLVLGPGDKLTLKAKPASGYVFKSWSGPCRSTKGNRCKIKGSKGKEHFTARFARR
jgi:Divergent InlB B-repeat domain